VWERGEVCTCVQGFGEERMKEITWRRGETVKMDLHKIS
jgi:hypothetical protein